MAADFKYWAFISYSHQDKQWGDWLHKALETYRVPRRLVARASRDGKVPKRLLPIFRDREELPTSSDLGANIETALAQSRYLIVICSPNAAVSRWVNQEVKIFKAMGREDRILCLTVDGEPNASDKPGKEANECFPPAIRFRVAPDRTLTDERVEPFSPDVRRNADGKKSARLKLIAGLIGVNYDELKQREKQRVLQWRLWFATGVLLMAGLIAGVWQWQEERKFEMARQERIESYTAAGRQKFLDGDPAQALAYLSAAYSEGGTNTALRFLLYQVRLALPRVSPEQHTMGVYSANFNPDATRVVTASEDSTAKIWDAATGRWIATLQHDKCVNSAVYSPDGRWIVTACDDGSARVWDAAATGKPEQRARLAGTGKIYPAIFNPQGDRIATASDDGTAAVWSADSYEKIALHGHSNAINSLEFSLDGKMIVTASEDRTARIWDAKSGEQMMVLGPHDSLLRHAMFSPDGTRVATCAESGAVQLWSTNGTRIPPLVFAHGNFVRRAAFSPDGKTLVTASAEGTVGVWNGETGDFKHFLKHAEAGEAKIVYRVVFSPDGHAFASVGANGMVKLWETATGRPLQSRDFHHDVIFGVEFSRNGQKLSSAGRKGKAFIWDVTSTNPLQFITSLDGGSTSAGSETSANLLRIFPGHALYVAVAHFSPDTRRIVTVDRQGKARVWNLGSAALPVLLASSNEHVNDAAFDDSGNLVVTGSEDGNVAVWELSATGAATRLTNFSAFREYVPVRSVRFVPKQRRFAVAGEEGGSQILKLVKLFDLTGGNTLATFDGTAPVFSPDGRLLVTLAKTNTAKVWDADGKLVAQLTGHGAPLVSARFSADSRRIATASEDHTAIVWDTAGNRLFSPLTNSPHGIFFAAFSSDNQRVITLGSDSAARIWNAHDGQPSFALEGEQHYVSSLSFNYLLPTATFSEDGVLVVTQSDENLVKVWDSVTGHMLAKLKGHSGNVSAMEFSRTGNRLLTGSQDRTALIWDMGCETNSPAEVARFVDENVPWKITSDGGLVNIPVRGNLRK